MVGGGGRESVIPLRLRNYQILDVHPPPPLEKILVPSLHSYDRVGFPQLFMFFTVARRQRVTGTGPEWFCSPHHDGFRIESPLYLSFLIVVYFRTIFGKLLTMTTRFSVDPVGHATATPVESRRINTVQTPSTCRLHGTWPR